MPLSYLPVDWNEFPGLQERVAAALFHPEKIEVTPDRERTGSPYQHHTPAPVEQWATITVTLRVRLPDPQ